MSYEYEGHLTSEEIIMRQQKQITELQGRLKRADEVVEAADYFVKYWDATASDRLHKSLKKYQEGDV